ncbi:MAG: arginine--tRNA ligase [Candidatus Hydrogenedentes bacterium]|nr:arginine--tRNA ligase [Candidatus Hydrogenedentota bacterium]
MNPFKTLTDPILAAYENLLPEDLDFGPPPKLEVGDVALRTFVAARKVKMKPPQLAADIADRVHFGPSVISATPAGPYLNFKLKRGVIAREILRAILNEGDRFGSDGSGTGKTILIEHTSINPNASPHVGRARNAMYGDSLVRLFRFEGYDADVHYYVNDIGRQIGLLVLHATNIADMSFDEMLDAYVEANARAENDPEFAEQGYELLAKMEEGDPDTAQRFHDVTELCLKGQLEVLGRLGITYDQFDRESKYLKDSRLEEVLEALRKNDAVFTDEEDRLVVDLSKIGHKRDEGRYFVLMRANGSSMYGFRDLAYTIDKMEKGADINLWVLGEDHKLYAEQLSLILRAAGKEPPEPVYYAHILLKEGRMSTRQGKVVLLSEFLDEAASRAAEKVEQQCSDLSPDEQKAIAEKVAISAVRFAILRVSPNKNVIFDWESSLSFSGDTGPYVQYCCARINSILRKFGEVPTELSEELPLEHDSEWMLMTKLAAFPDTVAAALAKRNVAPVAQFALDTARFFTTFYHDCPVLAAETEDQRTARAQLCAATLQTVTNALGILGIEALERM